MRAQFLAGWTNLILRDRNVRKPFTANLTSRSRERRHRQQTICAHWQPGDVRQRSAADTAIRRKKCSEQATSDQRCAVSRGAQKISRAMTGGTPEFRLFG